MTMAILHQLAIICLFLALAACSTTMVEMEGECILKRWNFFGIVMRSEVMCAMPHQRPEEEQIEEWEQVDPLGGAGIEKRLKESLRKKREKVEE